MDKRSLARPLDATTRTVREIFTGRRYALDYYQREYRWQERHIIDLLNDLTGTFLEDFEPRHGRREVATYKPYFLGAIITSHRSGLRYVIDGQQRLTSLLLVLLFLNKIQEEGPGAVEITPLIYSRQFGELAFNLDVPERTECMEALLHGRVFLADGASASTKTVWHRYQDIERLFPESLQGAALPYFIDWMVDRVIMVEIATDDDAQAYNIFETMNDRGLSLTPAEMLKGYVLANIRDDTARSACHAAWSNMHALIDPQSVGIEPEFLKTWLQAKHAQSMRLRKKDKQSHDYELIAGAFHRWVRDNALVLGLGNADDYVRLVAKDLPHAANIYRWLLHYSHRTYDSRFESLYAMGYLGHNVQAHLALAAVANEDDEITAAAKVRVTSRYADILVARYLVAGFLVGNVQGGAGGNPGFTLRRRVFELCQSVRDVGLDTLVGVLVGDLHNNKPVDFSRLRTFFLSSRSLHSTKYVLARLTAFVEQACGKPSSIKQYLRPDDGQRSYQIEHIIPARLRSDADSSAGSSLGPGRRYRSPDPRNMLGALVLLPSRDNQSYGDQPYEVKREHYFSQNLLASSLHPMCYERNPAFLQFCRDTNLPFRPVDAFDSEAIRDRQELYLQICNLVWSVDRIVDDARLLDGFERAGVPVLPTDVLAER